MPADRTAVTPAGDATPDLAVTTHRGDARPTAGAAPAGGSRFVLGDKIDAGGMGTVYRATDTTFRREVAVKLLQEQFAPDSGTARRFADEAHITGQLQHPGIPPVHDFGTLPDGRPFLAMKLIKGESLDRLLKTRRDAGEDRGRFVAVFEAVCQAVGYAHAHDVIHRDLKPANVMVGKFGEVQVMDWGLAKVLRPGAAGTPDDPDATGPDTALRSLRGAAYVGSRAGSEFGTLSFMSTALGGGASPSATPRSDVFGLGAILAVILTGRPPFAAGSADTTRVQAAQGDVAECFARLDGCGAEPELVALCKRCLSPRPADRPAHAGEVAAAVAEFRAQAEARARQAELDRVKAEGERATAEATAAEGRKRRRVQVWLAAAAVLIVAGAGGVAVWRVDEEGKKRTEAVRLEGEENQRRQAERERAARAADAVAALLDLAMDSLAARDARLADLLLKLAESRAGHDGVTDHAARLAAARATLTLLRGLDRMDAFRWTPLKGSMLPTDERVAEQWAGMFAAGGLVPGRTPPVEFAARVRASPIREPLVAALDMWLSMAGSEPVRAALAAADPDPFRDEVRRLLAAGDQAGLVALADRPEWATQPLGLVRAWAWCKVVPDEVGRGLLTRAAATRPNDFDTLMQLGMTYEENRPDTANDRVRCFQAAVALRPGHATARLNLGMSLHGRQDAAGALAEYAEALRIKPDYPAAYTARGITLLARRDHVAAAAAFDEAIRLDPTDSRTHNNLGNALLRLKDLDGAAAAYQESIRLDPRYHLPRNGLGKTRQAAGRYEEAAAAFREAIRLNPQYSPARVGLAECERAPRGEVPTAPPPRPVAR